jgi:hypothetical protein
MRAQLQLDNQSLPSELAAVVTSSTGLGGTTATTVTLQHAPPAPSVYVPYPVAPPPPMLVVPPPPAPPGKLYPGRESCLALSWLHVGNALWYTYTHSGKKNPDTPTTVCAAACIF